MRSESDFTPSRAECPDPWRWHARDEQATEAEVGVLLAGFVVALRPRRVLETGAYLGYTTEALGRVIVWGHVDAVEVDPDRAAVARARCSGLPVTVHATSSLDFWGGPYEFAFFDSDPPIRPEEMRRFHNPGAVWALHDARHPEATDALERLHTEGVITPWVYLPTPRGLAIGKFA